MIILGTNLFGNIASIWFIGRFGRRTVFIVGQVLACLTTALISTFALLGVTSMIVPMLSLNLFCVQMSLGPIAVLYPAEVCADAAFTVVFLAQGIVQMAQLCIVPIFTETFIGTVGIFYTFSVISLIGLLFVCKSIAELSDLTDAEKKEVFMPGAKWGRKLKPGE